MSLPAAYNPPPRDYCPNCHPHGWHGLPCRRTIWTETGTPCGCLGPWYGDPDAWLPKTVGLDEGAAFVQIKGVQD